MMLQNTPNVAKWIMVDVSRVREPPDNPFQNKRQMLETCHSYIVSCILSLGFVLLQTRKHLTILIKHLLTISPR